MLHTNQQHNNHTLRPADAEKANDSITYCLFFGSAVVALCLLSTNCCSMSITCCLHRGCTIKSCLHSNISVATGILYTASG